MMPARRRSAAPATRSCEAAVVRRKLRRCMGVVYRAQKSVTFPVCGYHLSMKLICAAAICVALSAQERVPGSAPLTFEGDPAVAMVSGIHAYLDRELQRPGAAATRRRPGRNTGAAGRG